MRTKKSHWQTPSLLLLLVHLNEMFFHQFRLSLYFASFRLSQEENFTWLVLTHAMNSGSNHNKAYPFFNPVNNSSSGWTNSSLRGHGHGVGGGGGGGGGVLSSHHQPAHALERKHSLNYENFGSFQRHLLNGYGNHSSLGASISTQINDSVKGTNRVTAEQYDLNESVGNLANVHAFGNDESANRSAENASPSMSYHHYRNDYLRKKSFDVNALRAIYERNQQYGSDLNDGLYHINQQPHHLQSNFYRSTNTNNHNNPGLQHSPISDMNNNHSLGFRANFDDVTSASMLAAQRASILARNNAASSHSFSSPRPADTNTSNDTDKSGSTASLHKSASSNSSPSSSFSVSSDSLNLNNPSTSSLASSFNNNRFGNYLLDPHLQNKQRPHHAPNAFAHHLINSQMNKPAQISDVNELNRLRNFRIGELSSALVDQHLKNLVSNNSGQNADNEKMFSKDSMLKPGFGNFQPTINKRPKSTFPFGKCKVCSDKATGVHYGIATCEGCKVSRRPVK